MARTIDLEERKQFRVLLNPVRQDIIHLLIDRIFCNLDFIDIWLCVGTKAVNCKVRVNVFRINRC